MNEREIFSKFYNFLENEKKYPSNSLLKQAPTITKHGKNYQIDLLLLDTKIGEYIGVVEFANIVSPDIKSFAKHKIQLYLQGLKTENIPFYLVFPSNESEFQILVYEDPEWKAIDKEEFPEFETLSAKKKIQEKESAHEIKELIVKKTETIRKEKVKTSFWSLFSTILGLTTAILIFYSSPDKKDLEEEYFNNKSTIDSLVIKLQELDAQKITSKIDTMFIIDSSMTFIGIEKRVQTMEKAFVDNPKKTLEINNIYKDLEKIDLKIEYQNKLISQQNENLINRIEWLNAITMGVIISLLGAALGPIIINALTQKN